MIHHHLWSKWYCHIILQKGLLHLLSPCLRTVWIPMKASLRIVGRLFRDAFLQFQCCRRPLSELISTYIRNHAQTLSEYDIISKGIYASTFQGLTLTKYCMARSYYCHQNHHQPCTNYMSMIQAALIVLNGGIVLYLRRYFQLSLTSWRMQNNVCYRCQQLLFKSSNEKVQVTFSNGVVYLYCVM